MPSIRRRRWIPVAASIASARRPGGIPTRGDGRTRRRAASVISASAFSDPFCRVCEGRLQGLQPGRQAFGSGGTAILEELPHEFVVDELLGNFAAGLGRRIVGQTVQPPIKGRLVLGDRCAVDRHEHGRFVAATVLPESADKVVAERTAAEAARATSRNRSTSRRSVVCVARRVINIRYVASRKRGDPYHEGIWPRAATGSGSVPVFGKRQVVVNGWPGKRASCRGSSGPPRDIVRAFAADIHASRQQAGPGNADVHLDRPFEPDGGFLDRQPRLLGLPPPRFVNEEAGAIKPIAAAAGTNFHGRRATWAAVMPTRAHTDEDQAANGRGRIRSADCHQGLHFVRWTSVGLSRGKRGVVERSLRCVCPVVKKQQGWLLEINTPQNGNKMHNRSRGAHQQNRSEIRRWHGKRWRESPLAPRTPNAAPRM